MYIPIIPKVFILIPSLSTLEFEVNLFAKLINTFEWQLQLSALLICLLPYIQVFSVGMKSPYIHAIPGMTSHLMVILLKVSMYDEQADNVIALLAYFNIFTLVLFFSDVYRSTTRVK